MSNLQRKSLLWFGMIFLISQLSVTVAQSLVFSHQIKQSQQNLCEITAIAQIPAPTPPASKAQTPYGKDDQRYTQEVARIAQRKLTAMRHLSENSHCEDK